jgi:hypothetical protein
MTVAQLSHLIRCGVPGIKRVPFGARDRDEGAESWRVTPKNVVGTRRAAPNWP